MSTTRLGGEPTLPFLVLCTLMVSACAGTSAPSSASPTAAAAATPSTVTATVTHTVAATPAEMTVTATVAADPAEITVTKTVDVTHTTTKTVEVPPDPVGVIRDGVWTVGRDIEPGQYRPVKEIQERCYWAILVSGTNGRDIVANDNVSGGFPVVTLSEGQDFESNRCGEWAKE